MTDGRHIAQEDLTLHAMQALSSEESAAVRLHLAECEACRGELAEIAGDLALVAISVEQHPVPEGARQRFLDRVSKSAASEAGNEKENPINTPAPEPQPKPRGVVVPIARHPLAKQPSAWGPWMSAAALAILAVGLGARVRSLNEQLDEMSKQIAAQAAQSQQARDVLDVLTAPTAQHILLTAAKTPPAPTARAVYVAARGALILEASNLSPLPDGKTYELWVIPANGNAPIPAGLFRPDSSGSASLLLPRIPEGVPAKAFGVTVENAGGAATPTAPILLSGATPSSGE